jgi:hypothetical protein
MLIILVDFYEKGAIPNNRGWTQMLEKGKQVPASYKAPAILLI